MEIQDTIRLQKIYAAVMEMALQSHATRPDEAAAQMFQALTGICVLSIGNPGTTINDDRQQRIAVAWEWLFGKEEPKVPRRPKKPVLERICDTLERMVPSRGVGAPR